MLSQLGQAMVMLADTMMVGRIGTNELAAVSFANAVFLVGFVLAQGIAFGSTPVIGPNYATGNYRKAGLLFQHSIVVDATAAIAIGGGMYALSYFMDRMGQEEAVWRLAVPYYRTLVISLFPLSDISRFQAIHGRTWQHQICHADNNTDRPAQHSAQLDIHIRQMRMSCHGVLEQE